MVSIVSISALVGSGLDLRGSLGAIADELAQEGVVAPVIKEYHFDPSESLGDVDAQRDYVLQTCEWASRLTGEIESDGVGTGKGDEVHAFVTGPISFVVQVGRVLRGLKATVIAWNRNHDGSWVRLPPAGYWLGSFNHFKMAMGWGQCLDTSCRDIHLGFSARTEERDGQCMCIDAVAPSFTLLSDAAIRREVTATVEELLLRTTTDHTSTLIHLASPRINHPALATGSPSKKKIDLCRFTLDTRGQGGYYQDINNSRGSSEPRRTR